MSGDPNSPLTAGLAAAIQAGALRYRYRGLEMQKDPFDLALYQLLLWNERPATIMEIGSRTGASALWLADHARLFGLDAQVVSLDRNPVALEEPGVFFLTGDVADLARLVDPVGWRRPLLVIDDGSHQYRDVMTALRFFDGHLRPGEMMVIEDGIVDLLGDAERLDGGPRRAITEFLAAHPAWTVDRTYCDFFGRNVTWNVDGYLRRQ